MSDLDPKTMIGPYLDGELAAGDRALFEAAMAEDLALAAEVEELRAMLGDLAALPAPSAPKGHSAAVFARVAGLEIPGLSDATETPSSADSVQAVEPSATSEALDEHADIGLSTETGLATDIPGLAWAALVGPEGLGGLFRALASSTWVKVPVGAAAALGLVLGLVQVLTPEQPAAPEADLLAQRSSPEPTGPSAAPEIQEDDGVVALDEEALEDRPLRKDLAMVDEETKARADEGSLDGAALGSRGGVKASAEKREADLAPGTKAREEWVPPLPASGAWKAPKRKPKSVVGPDGVYQADWEDQRTAEEARQRAASMEAAGAVGPPTSSAVVAESGNLDAGEGAPSSVAAEKRLAVGAAEGAEADDAVAFGGLEDVTIDSEPLEDYLEPAADAALLAETAAEPAPARRRRAAAGPSADVADGMVEEISAPDVVGQSLARRGGSAVGAAGAVGAVSKAEQSPSERGARYELRIASPEEQQRLIDGIAGLIGSRPTQRTITGGVRLEFELSSGQLAGLTSLLQPHSPKVLQAPSAGDGVLAVRVDVRN